MCPNNLKMVKQQHPEFEVKQTQRLSDDFSISAELVAIIMALVDGGSQTNKG